MTLKPSACSARRLGVLLLLCSLAAPAGAYAAGRAYVSNEDEHSVTVIDTDRNEVVGSIAVGKRPRGMKLMPDGKKLLVAVSGLPKCPPSVPDEECAKLEHDLQADGIAVVDTMALKLTTLLQAGSDPEQFDLTTDGKLLIVANEDSATATVLDVASGKIRTHIPVGREPEGVRVSPNGQWILVTNESDHSISLIDAKSLKVLRTVQVGERPRDIAFTPDNRTAYVSGEFDSSIYRIALPGGEPVVRLVQLRKEARPMAVALDAKRNRLYVSTGRGGTVAVIAVDKPALIAEVPVGARPWGMALSADGKHIYTANGPSNDVSVLDTQTLQVVKKIPVGRSPWGIVLSR